ncbi:unnamed protein product [Medioppia subpectinata]|uniref:Uncharacterized protein n=1 Tax=Medioppia subpectinata TaxID=1979941 RepID=A0A7R9QGC3_9ACAR|nr:unnamed protein product [Medioppia subpectinata]CAG2119858.1 unnamed protein product [Medioppia subpectinata]
MIRIKIISRGIHLRQLIMLNGCLETTGLPWYTQTTPVTWLG